jgi:hypothetical protein
VFTHWIESSLSKTQLFTEEVAIITQQWSEVATALSSNTKEQVTRNARDVMQRIAHLTSGVLLLADAARDNNIVSIEVARRWLMPATLVSMRRVEEDLLMDQKIVFGSRPIWLGVE